MLTHVGRADQDLMLGSSHLTEVSDELEGTQDLAAFFNNVREFLAKLVNSAVKRLPLKDPVLNDP